MVSYMIRSKKDLVNKIIPFFDTYKLRGLKKVKYERWREKLLKKFYEKRTNNM